MADFISGLLGMGDEQDPMARAKQAGLLGLGASLLQAGSPSLTPTSLGAALGQGVMTGQQMSQQALGQARQQAIQQEMMGTMSGGVGGAGGDVQAQIAKLQKMALLDPKNQAAYLKIAEQLQGKTAAFTGETANAALNLFGTADVSKLTPQQRQQATEAADAARMRTASASAPRMSVNTSDPTAVGRELRAISNDFAAATKDDREIAKTYKAMQSYTENPSPASDISLVFAFYKTIDPTSVVREGEYDKLKASAGLPDRVRSYINTLQTGQQLTDAQRKDLLDTARYNVASRIPQAEHTVNLYTNLVSTLKEDPNKVIRNPYAGLFDNQTPPPRNTPPAAPPSGAPRTNPPRRWNPQTREFE
jgi:hypothetical protein